MNIYVLGLGHIGLPMAVWMALKDHSVTGIDIDPVKIKSIYDGKISIHEFYEGKHISHITKDLLNLGKLRVQSKFERLDDQPSVFVITVGIVDKPNGTQDISPIENILTTITPYLKDKDLIIFKTTMIPGTIDQLVVPRIKALNRKVYVAYSPETISETYAFHELETNERILSAMDKESYFAAEKFLKSLTSSPIHKATSIKLAETVKVVQNIHRDVNIALANEVSEIALDLGIPMEELRSLINTHPRVQLLEPGPGVGGYCLPNALKYLQNALEIYQKDKTLLMNTARELNTQRPYKIAKQVKEILKTCGKEIKNTKIAVIGLAMKDYCANYRYSPAMEIIYHLQEMGAQVKAFDPLVPNIISQEDSFIEAIKNTDCMVITAKQEGITYDPIEISNQMNAPAIVIDTRNTIKSHPSILLFKI